jgi:hypothetical protein
MNNEHVSNDETTQKEREKKMLKHNMVKRKMKSEHKIDKNHNKVMN